MTKAVSIAIIGFVYLTLLTMGVFAALFIRFNMDHLNQTQIVLGGLISVSVAVFALFKGTTDVLDLADEK